MVRIPHLTLWLLPLLDCMLSGSANGDGSCQDSRSSCRRIGARLPLSRCYKKFDECCATCSKLQLQLPGCPYGDRENGCGSIGGDRPISDCYDESDSCCGTCALYSRGTPGCEFGDRLNWCSEIGSRYLVSTCYEEENNCCDTCSRFRSNKPGCEYGDHANWCSLVGVEFCLSDPHLCCQTCETLLTTTTAPQADEPQTTAAFDLNESVTSHSQGRQTPSTSRVPNTYTGSPGRPSTAPSAGQQHSSSTVNTSTTRNVQISQKTTSNIRPTTNTTTTTVNPTGDKNADSQPGSNHTSRDVLCSELNVTGHHIRHNKHGGRHRTRGGIDCVNATNVNATEASPVSTSEPLWLIISKGLAPISQTSATDSKSSKNAHNSSKPEDQVATWSGVQIPTVSMTTGNLGSGHPGEMDYQGDFIPVFSAAGSRSPTVTRSHLKVWIAIAVCDILSRSVL